MNISLSNGSFSFKCQFFMSVLSLVLMDGIASQKANFFCFRFWLEGLFSIFKNR